MSAHTKCNHRKRGRTSIEVIEIYVIASDDGSLTLPAVLLKDMGIGPKEQVRVAYIQNAFGKNQYKEFFFSPNGIDTIDSAASILVPEQILEEAKLLQNDEIQIICIEGAIVLAGERAFETSDLIEVLNSLLIVNEIAGECLQEGADPNDDNK